MFSKHQMRKYKMTDLFQEKAKDWDANDRRKQLSSGIGSCILKNVSMHEQMHVLDFGAGTGLISSQIAPHVEKITAVDVSESMLEKLSSKPELKGKVEILCQDITDKPIGIEYDLLMSAMSMHHVKDTDNMVKQFAAHLKRGGKIALADLDSEDGTFHTRGTEGVYHNGFDRTKFAAILQKYGFIHIRFETAYTVQGVSGTYPIFLALATKG
ncbi:MAG: class I SAM-dependent methyltransferase [Paralcaligenes sp.]